MNPIYINAVETFVSIYSHDAVVTHNLRSREAKRPLAVIDACFESEAADFNTLLYFVERATSTDNPSNLLKPYIFKLAEIASTTEQMFTVWKFFVVGKTWNPELTQLIRRIIESDPSVETYARITELLLARI